MQMDQHEDCISFAESFLRISGTNPLVEKAFYLMADAQMTLRRYQNAVSSLNRLKDKPGLPSDEQYFYYQLASAYEKAGNITEAVVNYRRSYESNKFTQIAYQIEDKLFALRSTNRSQVDISFLYPYTELNIPVPSDSLSSGTQQNTASNPVVPNSSTLEPQRVNARPNSGYYLQAGRFSVEANAVSRATEICTKNLQSLYFQEQQGGRSTWVVMSGPFSSSAEAETARNLLISNNIDCFAVRY
jgi:tetratricopeptide (TPR) repeat protein